MLLALFAIIATLVLVVGIHELGHALAARCFKIPIKRISIGFGKPLIQWSSASGIEWRVGMWPLGGYVHLANSRISPVAPEDLPFAFDRQPIRVRLVVLLSGVLANLLVAVLGLVLVYSLGMSQRVPLIKQVIPNSIANQAGFKNGDELQSINESLTRSWEDAGRVLVGVWGQTMVPVTVVRDGTIHRLSLDLSQQGIKGSLLTQIGWVPDLKCPTVIIKSASVFGAVTLSFQTISEMLYFFMMILVQLVKGVIPFSVLAGPIGLFSMSIVTLGQGVVVFSYFIAILSLAVAFVNLAPIPGLDGGGVVYTLIEAWRGRPVSVALEVLLFRLVCIAMALLLVQLILNDLNHWIKP